MKKADRTRRIVLSAIVPFDVGSEELVDFVVEALEAWGGQRHPSDPLFNSIGIKSVTTGGRLYVNKNPKEFE